MQYAVRSPLHYVANVKTPTMVMTGEADLRTPMRQSEEFYRALKMLKKETLLVRMPDEYHGWRRPSHQLLQQLYLMAWFEKYSNKNKVVRWTRTRHRSNKPAQAAEQAYRVQTLVCFFAGTRAQAQRAALETQTKV